MHPINQTLLIVLDNQIARTRAAFDGMDEAAFDAEPGRDCNSIRRIGRHLVALRRFQMELLSCPGAERIDVPERVVSVEDLLARLDGATSHVRSAIAEHDPDDWYAVPDAPRAGKWGDEPTILRFVRPLNDFTNHLGAVRTIRRLCGNPVDRTQ